MKALLILFTFSFFLPHCGDSERKEPENNRPDLLAFYYPWYGNPRVSGKWIHWNASGHDPDRKVNGLPDIASPFHPVLDPYDSADTSVIEQHLRWAKYAGIKAFIVSWWGQNDLTDRNFGRMMDVVVTRFNKFKLSLYYERGSTSPSRIKEDIDYICEKYSWRKGYYHFKGKPVLFIYGRAIYPAFWSLAGGSVDINDFYVDWSGIIKFAEKDCNMLLVADVMTPRFSSVMENVYNTGFKAIHVYNPAFEFYSNFDPDDHYREISLFARNHHLIYGLTVIPGYNDTELNRKFKFSLDRGDGELYRILIKKAVRYDPDWIIITSFNEWHEGTQIEPSIEYGMLYLNITRELLSKVK